MFSIRTAPGPAKKMPAYLLLTAAATAVTILAIFPVNRRMEEGIGDPVDLQATLRRWRGLNTVRASLWSVQWAAIMAWWIARK